jgi:hypothetical protein
MLSTAAPDFRPGSSLFSPVERRSVTLVSGRLGGVRCGLSGPASIQARRNGPRVHLWPDRGRIGAAHPSSDDMPVAAANHDGSRSGDGRRPAGFERAWCTQQGIMRT